MERNRRRLKQFLFFWCVFHITGYISFLTCFTPSVNNVKTETMQVVMAGTGKVIHESFDVGRIDYLFTPAYIDYTHPSKNNHLDRIYTEKMYFYPFHSFTYRGFDGVKGFIGIWGYYGHYEFLLYIVLPMIIFLLYRFYRKFINN